MLLHVDDLLNRVVDGLDLHDVLVVDQPEPELAAGAPAGVDALVAREGTHQLEGVLSHVFKDRVELRRWSGASSSAGSRSFGCSRLEQRSLGGKVFLELHNQGADVTTRQANQDRLDLVILARKDVGGDDALVGRGHWAGTGASSSRRHPGGLDQEACSKPLGPRQSGPFRHRQSEA